jgi:hypothetical protein
MRSNTYRSFMREPAMVQVPIPGAAFNIAPMAASDLQSIARPRRLPRLTRAAQA